MRDQLGNWILFGRPVYVRFTEQSRDRAHLGFDPIFSGRALLVLQPMKHFGTIAALFLTLAMLGLTVSGLGHASGPLDLASQGSHVAVDRNGRLLRAFTTPDGRWRLPVAAADVDPRFIAMLIAYEDRRFYAHHGVDFLSLGRAALQWASHGHIVSGGSTLTMQVARLIEPRAGKSLVAIEQILHAEEIERRTSKNGVLDLYLALAPYGGNIEGIRAASLSYFGREPKRLSIAEAALLVALPQSPEMRRPDRFPDAARAARDAVLDLVWSRGVITAAERDAAKREAVPRERRPFPVLAAHASEEAFSRAPQQRIHQLTLDAKLQASLEILAREAAAATYELGAARRLYKDEAFAPDVIAGVSIGAITAVLLARPAPGLKPLEALEAFWQKITVSGLFLPPPLRPYASALGNPNFFVPRIDYYALASWTNFYDTEPLRQTLSQLVDLKALADPKATPGLLVSATDVEAGQIEYFYRLLVTSFSIVSIGARLSMAPSSLQRPLNGAHGFLPWQADLCGGFEKQVSVDGPDGKRAWDDLRGRNGDVPKTLCTKTARGWHLFYKSVLDIPTSTSCRSRGTGAPAPKRAPSAGYLASSVQS
jgi:Transglycosylase/Patatin-like phospholipase